MSQRTRLDIERLQAALDIVERGLQRSSTLPLTATQLREAVVSGTKMTGFRGTQDLESEIYGWLVDHAIFREEEDA